jgi:thioredoxin-related protein
MKNLLLLCGLFFLPALAYAQLKKYDFTQYEQAKTEAQAQKKELLVVITGSKWCKPCIKMKRNVFDNQEFIEYAQNRFVIFEIDVEMPMNFNSENYKTYTTFKEKHQTSAFPTLIITDTEGNKKLLIDEGLTSLEKTMKQLKNR